MTDYEWRTVPETLAEEFSLPGRIVHFSPYREYPNSGASMALVELNGEKIDSTPIDVELDDGNPTCVGKDGDCSRTVDEPGDTCWQHDEGDE